MGAITAVFMIPTLILAGWLAFRSVASEQLQTEQNAHHRAREITTAVERDIVSTQNILAALAGSQDLQDGALEKFYLRAAEVSQQLNLRIALRDAETEQYLFNTAFPWGTHMSQNVPNPVRDAMRQSLTSGRPTVSGVIFEPTVKRYLVAVLGPVRRAGRVAYFLCAGLPLDNFAIQLNQLQLDNRWTATITDRNGVIVARSEKHDAFAGKQVRLYIVARDLPPF